MHIIAIGMSVATAPVTVRGRFAFAEAKRSAALKQIRHGLPMGAGECAPEAAILSTCHRVELYAACTDSKRGQEALIRFLYDFHAVPLGQFDPHLYHLEDASAIHHLFRVAAGLDSPILGETQILGQVTQALDLATQQEAAGPYLSALFQHAIHAAKRVHSETLLGQASLSVGRVAAMSALRLYRGAAAPTVLILGAGKMAELAALYLYQQERGAHIVVVNRSRERGEALAQKVSGAYYAWEAVSHLLAQADIVLCATSAPHLLLDEAEVAQAVQQRPSRPLVVVDMAVPRNVAPAIAGLPNVFLIGIDNIGQSVDAGLQERRDEVAQAEAILEAEISRYLAWHQARSVVPLIKELREQAEAIRQQELARFAGRVGLLEEREQEQLEVLTQRLINKLLHRPIVRLKEQSVNGHGAAYSEVVRDLFDLGDAG